MPISRLRLTVPLLLFSVLAGCQTIGGVPAGEDVSGNPDPSPSPSVKHVGRLGGVEFVDGVLDDEPHLVLGEASAFKRLYDDRGTGSRIPVSVWRPQLPSDAYALIGDYAKGDYEWPGSSFLVVRALNENPANPLLKPPVDYRLIWTSKGTGGRSDGSFWEPVAPSGYVAIGMVGNSSFEKPLLDSYRCVRQDLCEQRPYGHLIWNDRGTGARTDVALYGNDDFPGLFGAFDSWKLPTTPSWVLKKPHETLGG